MIKEADTNNEGQIDFLAFANLMSRKMAEVSSSLCLLPCVLCSLLGNWFFYFAVAVLAEASGGLVRVSQRNLSSPP